MATPVLHRRHRRAGARLYARNQPGRRPAVDGGDREAHAQARGLHRRRGQVREADRPRRHQDHAAGARAAGRAAVGQGTLEEGLSQARRFRPRLRGAAAGRDRAVAGHGRRDRADRRPAPLPVRRSGRAPRLRRSRSGRRFRRRDDQRDGEGLRRDQVRGPSLPARRRARAGREAPRRHLRADPEAAQQPQGPAPHHGVHRSRCRRSREPGPAARGFRTGAGRGRRDAGRARSCGADCRARRTGAHAHRQEAHHP